MINTLPFGSKVAVSAPAESCCPWRQTSLCRDRKALRPGSSRIPCSVKHHRRTKPCHYSAAWQCEPRPSRGHFPRGAEGARSGIIEFGAGEGGLGCPITLVPPPAIKTLPSGSNVAVCPLRGVVMLPVALNVPVRGSYNSALDSVV